MLLGYIHHLQASKYIKPTYCEVKKQICGDSGESNKQNNKEEATSAFQFIKMWEACSKCDVEFEERSDILRNINPRELNKGEL